MLKKALYCMMAMVMFSFFSVCPTMAQATHQYKVLVVMSYEDDFHFEMEMKEGIDAALAETCEVKYFYMDTKRNLAGGKEKAKEAYALYQEFQPDGVIAADDNAQSMFVVPYLRDKVGTPVTFCGVNGKPEKYGYPASNVTGILERFHVHESVALAKQLVPSIKNFAIVARDIPTGKAFIKQIKGESDSYPVKFLTSVSLKTFEELIVAARELKGKCDALHISQLQKMPDAKGNIIEEKKAIATLTEIFGKPISGNGTNHVKSGVLCSVTISGKEHGETASKMLLKAMQGTPVSEIPITWNQHGKAMINVTTMKALGIKPNPRILHTAELVKTKE